MGENIWMAAVVLFPLTAGTVLLLLKNFNNRSAICIYTGISLAVEGLLVLALLLAGGERLVLLELMEGIEIAFFCDALGKLFLAIVSVVWILTGFFSFSYMKHEGHERRFFGFYLLVFGTLTGLGCSANLVTMYAFFEFLTVASFPLVLHNQSRSAILASLKYLFFSLFGAYMALFGLFVLRRYAVSLDFAAGGTLDLSRVGGNLLLLQLAAFFMILGFSVKAGMFPMQAWLWAAHPVAPSPASAVLSGIVVKAGVFAIVRTVFELFGADFIRGTWVQYAFLSLSLFSVLLGSMLAFFENVLKKRLAYSTVSQVSYILAGIACLEPTALVGALLHVTAHALIKCVLFLGAGAIIFKTGATTVDGLDGIGKRMPVTLWCFALASLGLIGIPPTSGFISKWYLALGALNAQTGVFRYLVPVVLLVSALLTAGYLLPIVIRGFFPGANYRYEQSEKCEADGWMLVPMLVLAALSVLIGVFPNALIDDIRACVGTMF